MGGLANLAKMQQGGGAAGGRGQPRPDASQMAAMQVSPSAHLQIDFI